MVSPARPSLLIQGLPDVAQGDTCRISIVQPAADPRRDHMKSNAQIAPQKAIDRRAHERFGTALAGKFYVPAQKIVMDCEVTNLSGGGASVRCAQPALLNTNGVLYIEGLGRFECVTTRYAEGLLGLTFVCNEAKRQRLTSDLAIYVNSGMAEISRLRRDPRNASARCSFKLPCGEIMYCDVIDISLQGV